MKKSSEFIIEKKVDYFELWSKVETDMKPEEVTLKPEETPIPVKKETKNIVFSQADRARRAELKAAKEEIYSLSMGKITRQDILEGIAVQNRRTELINCKRALKAKGYI